MMLSDFPKIECSFMRWMSLIIVCFISMSSMAKNRVVFYEPKIVNLSGVIKMLKFPGPPNFESIKHGDADETGPYLYSARDEIRQP